MFIDQFSFLCTTSVTFKTR